MSHSAALAADAFPAGPDSELTPGSLCTSSGKFRYPEHIRYCERSVGTSVKREIIEVYDTNFDYSIGEMDRSDFKIDHYIPLCMGGSNNRDNLWPQHRSVFEITDKLEQYACEKMAQGKLLQRDAIRILKQAKADLVEAPRLIEQVRAL